VSEPLENRDAMLDRFKEATGGRPYAWAARNQIPRHVVVSLLNGTYAPQRKTRLLIEERTGLSAEWLVYGRGPKWLAGREEVEASESPAGAAEARAPEARSTSSEPDYLTNGKDLALMAVASAAVNMFLDDLDLDNMSAEQEGALVGMLYDKFFERRRTATARMMADFLVAAWRSSRQSAA